MESRSRANFIKGKGEVAMGQNTSKKLIAPKTSAEEKLFHLICQTYDLTDPIDQILANRAAGQLMRLQEFDQWIKDKGGGSIFYSQGDGIINVHPAGYFMKQLEGEFRANIKLLRDKTKLNKMKEAPQDFSKWLQDDPEE